MIVGMLPTTSLTAHAAESITLSGNTYTKNPGHGFEFDISFRCSSCDKSIGPDTNIEGHSFSINTITYRIAGGSFTCSFTCTAAGCSMESRNIELSFSGTYNCGTKLNYWKHRYLENSGSQRGTINMYLKRSATAHSGDATCKTAANCTLCGTSYTNASNHEQPDDFTYSINTSDNTKHDVKYACCDAVKETVAHTGEPTYTVNATDKTKHDKTYSCCNGVAETSTHSSCTYDLNLQNAAQIIETCSNDCNHSATATITAVDKTYTGAAITDAATVTYSDGWTGSKDAVVTYENNTKVGTATAKATIEGQAISTTFQITAADISGATVTFNPTSGDYNGSAYTPSVSVTFDGKPLAENDDYTIAWDPSNLINADTYTATITGNGNFTGTKTATFSINPVELDETNTVVTLDENTFVYDGTEHKPNVTVTYKGVPLTQGVDYKVTYLQARAWGNGKPTQWFGPGETSVECINADDWYYAVVEGMGNYYTKDKFTLYAPFVINQREIEIEWTNTEFTFDGNEKLPTATVKNLVTDDTCNITVSGGEIDAGSYTATAESIDNNSNYKLPTNNTTTFVIKNASQDAPTTVVGVAETYKGKSDGKLTNLDETMEFYAAQNESDIPNEDTVWIAVPKNTSVIEYQKAGTYYVRYKAKTNYDASEPQKVTVGDGEMLKIVVPQNTVGYTVTANKTETEWYGSYSFTVTIHDGYTATEDFEIWIGEWNTGLEPNKEHTMSSAVADQVITVKGVADVTAPEVEMSVKGVGWKQFINKITFGLFFKENVEVKVEASDFGSKINKVEYLITETAFATEDAVKADTSTWTALTLENGVAKFNVTEKGKKYVYVRVTDNAGNITVVSSDGGVVVYTDSTADTTAISFIKTTTDDVTAKVNLNGNTVKAIYNGTNLIDSKNYSVAADGTITFKANYLDTLADGSYTLHIVYNPQGENYVESNINDAPAQTNITLNVGKQTGTVAITNNISKTYDGSAITAPTYDRNNVSGTVVVEYKKKGADDNTYSTDAPKTAGDYTVRVIVKADDAGFYTEAVSAPVDFTISKATLAVTVDNANANYGDAVPDYTVKYDGFKNGETESVLGGTLAFACDYAQFSDKGEYTIKASGYTSDNYEISYVDGKLTVSPKKIKVAINNATSVYGDPIVELTANDFGGIVNSDKNVYKLTTEATSTSGAGDYEIKGETLDDNYIITFMDESVSYTITKREITITVDAKNVIVNTALPTYTYTESGRLDKDAFVTAPTLTSDADIAVVGEYTITASGADAGSNYTIKYVPAKLTVLTDNAVDAAKGYEEEIKDLDPDTVTSEDKAELNEILEEINTILDDENITDNGKKALEETKEKVEELIKEITDAEAATDTENTDKVKDTTSENVKPEDKTDLEGAKDDLEKALEDHGNNMTEEEKKAIEDEIKRIDAALEVIGNVEAAEEKIGKLPETITKNDEDAIKAADDAYNALTDYEKSLVDEDAKKALDDAKAALAELNKPADSTSPNTGDTSNMFLWIALLFISGGAVITLTVVARKKRATKR